MDGSVSTLAPIFAAAFATGDTWNTFSEADLTNLRTGAGLGIRLEVPLVGRIGLDFGYGFDKTDPGWETHFNFGSIF